jgi:DNA-binding transcriptional ArsR family regulator
MTLPGVSKHLRVLQRAGLIEQGRRAQWRPCRLKAGPLKEVADWVEEYRRYWEESFDRLDEYLQDMKRKGTKRQERKEDRSGKES